MKSPAEILSNCIGFTWVTSWNTLEVLGENGINKEEAKSWLEYKRNELNFMATIGTLIASVVATSISWPGMENTHWVVRAFWYNATLLAILSAVMAFQQSSTLGHVLAKVINGHSLGDALLKKGMSIPSKTAIFVLQAPIQMLTYGIAMYLMGLLVYVIYPVSRASYPAEDTKIAIFFGILLPINCGFFIAALILLQRLGDSL